MSRDFLSHIIRTYGGSLHSMIGSYLEQSVKLFVAQQREMRERGKAFSSNDTEAVAGLASRNYQRWKSVQDEIYSTLVRAAGRGAEDDELGERRSRASVGLPAADLTPDRQGPCRRAPKEHGPDLVRDAGLSALDRAVSGALRRVDVAHGQAHATLTVDFEHLHAHHIAFLQLVADALDALVGDLRDVHEAVAARQDRDERTEVHQARDLAFVDATDFDVRRDQLDATLGFAARGTARPTRSSPCRRSRCRWSCRSLP